MLIRDLEAGPEKGIWQQLFHPRGTQVYFGRPYPGRRSDVSGLLPSDRSIV